MTVKRSLVRQIITACAVAAAFGTNVWANVSPINGQTVGEISNTIFSSVLIIPANYAFAIWGVIFLGLFTAAIYQALPSQQYSQPLMQTDWLLVTGSVAQILWVLVFLMRWYSLSLVAMLAILLPLTEMYRRLGMGKIRVPIQQHWCLRIPISIYLGWISVATIVNVAICLTHWGWTGEPLSSPLWTAIVSALGTCVAAVIAIQRADIAYTAITIWALVAIAIRNWSIPVIVASTLTLAVIAVIALIAGIGLQRARVQQEAARL